MLHATFAYIATLLGTSWKGVSLHVCCCRIMYILNVAVKIPVYICFLKAFSRGIYVGYFYNELSHLQFSKMASYGHRLVYVRCYFIDVSLKLSFSSI